MSDTNFQDRLEVVLRHSAAPRPGDVRWLIEQLRKARVQLARLRTGEWGRYQRLIERLAREGEGGGGWLLDQVLKRDREVVALRRRNAALRNDVARLQRLVEGLAARVADQAEVLQRLAEKKERT